MAHRTKLARSTIADLEAGRSGRDRHPSTYDAIAKAFELPVDRVLAASRGDIDGDETDSTALAGHFGDAGDGEHKGMKRATLIDVGERFGPRPPKYFYVPEEVVEGEELFATVLADDDAAPRMLKDDLIVWAEPRVELGRFHWIELDNKHGRRRMVRLVFEVGDRYELRGMQSHVEPVIVPKKAVARIGRVQYLSRAV